MQAESILALFIEDYKNFQFIDLNQELLIGAKTFLDKYGERGLRTLDAVQLATIVSVKD